MENMDLNLWLNFLDFMLLSSSRHKYGQICRNGFNSNNQLNIHYLDHVSFSYI